MNVKIEPISVRNKVSRSIMKGIDFIIEGAITNESSPVLMISLAKYKAAIDLLTKYHELTEEEQDESQDLIDDFYQSWIDVFGEEGVTNLQWLWVCMQKMKDQSMKILYIIVSNSQHNCSYV